MNKRTDKKVQSTRFEIERLQKQIEILEASRADLEKQIRKLNDAVPEDQVDKDAVKDGYMAYGSYAQAIIARKENLRATLEDVNGRYGNLASKLKGALDALDSFERIAARRKAAEAEKASRRAAG